MQATQTLFFHRGVETSKNEIMRNYTVNTSNYPNISNIHFTDNPIMIHDDTITIHGESIQIQRYYEFHYKGKRFLLYRPSKDITEIYTVK